MTKRVLIVGASGLLGGMLLHELPKRGLKVFGTFHSRPHAGLERLDVTRLEDCAAAFDRAAPDWCVLAAAYTHVDGCEEDPQRAQRVNVEGTRHVAQAARARGTRLVFLSTDYVFDGALALYSEEDEPRPLNVYGQTKLEGERIVAAEEGLVLRTSGLYGFDPQSKNFAMQVLGNLRARRSMKVADDMWGSPTPVAMVSELIGHLIEADEAGLFHASGRDCLSRFDFAVRLSKGLGLDPTLLVRGRLADQGRTPRPARSCMASGKVERLTGFRCWGVQEGIADFVGRAGSGPSRAPL